MVVFRNRLFFIITVVIIFDQLVKFVVKNTLFPSDSVVLIPKILSLTYIMNTGAIFGMLRGMNTLLIVVGIAVVIGLLYYLYMYGKEETVPGAFALIIGGAISNIIDRIVYGSVIDFIDFHFWPAFNIADGAITMGVLSIVFYSLRKE